MANYKFCSWVILCGLGNVITLLMMCVFVGKLGVGVVGVFQMGDLWELRAEGPLSRNRL